MFKAPDLKYLSSKKWVSEMIAIITEAPSTQTAFYNFNDVFIYLTKTSYENIIKHFACLLIPYRNMPLLLNHS